MAKPTLPQGTRDFSPDTVRKRNFILSTVKNVFGLYGFQPLETPAMENLETLMGKYGEEGDKLIFRVLNNGLNDPKNIEKSRAAFENTLQGKNDANLTSRALRYDLTIPFARYVAMNHGQLVYPFKRYQVQPVWRADRPQKGRYREFYQCDADVVGSTSLMNEVDLAMIYHDAFTALKIDGYELRVNSRKILAGLSEHINAKERLEEMTIVIDKLDKIGHDKVFEELSRKGFTEWQVKQIGTYLNIGVKNQNEEKLSLVKELLGDTGTAKKGIAELEFILDKVKGKNINLVVDFTLARGLNYYTGIIFEAKAPASVQIGSIGGGGRYDDLTGLFGVPNIPGVGISFGVDRIYDVMEEMAIFPTSLDISTTVLFFNEGEEQLKFVFEIAGSLRKKNISCEIYPDQDKEEKQFKYAVRKRIQFIFSSDLGNYKLKNLVTSESFNFTASEVHTETFTGKIESIISSHK
ncbi:MAG: histidine--tRNA ligase [Chitinophagaceae bacterium]|nr:histidine--tRNA ligase [Chitinophagaceae bacterium]